MTFVLKLCFQIDACARYVPWRYSTAHEGLPGAMPVLAICRVEMKRSFKQRVRPQRRFA